MGQSLALLEVSAGPRREADLRIAHAWFAAETRSSVVVWETCLRTVLLASVPSEVALSTELPREFSRPPLFLAEEAAYGHLLEVVCGLRSPIAGETQVMGQFKEFLASLGNGPLASLLSDLLADAKAVRREWLGEITHGSYGSQSRRVLKPYRDVVVVGSGKLAREVAEWIASESRVGVFCRRPESAARDFSADAVLAAIPVRPLGALARAGAVPEGAAIVVAAPISGADLRRALGESRARAAFVLDLREESKTDPLGADYPETLSLRRFFEGMERLSRETEEKLAGARAAAARLARVRADRVVYRPFGWEDVCA